MLLFPLAQNKQSFIAGPGSSPGFVPSISRTTISFPNCRVSSICTSDPAEDPGYSPFPGPRCHLLRRAFPIIVGPNPGDCHPPSFSDRRTTIATANIKFSTSFPSISSRAAPLQEPTSRSPVPRDLGRENFLDFRRPSPRDTLNALYPERFAFFQANISSLRGLYRHQLFPTYAIANIEATKHLQAYRYKNYAPRVLDRGDTSAPASI